MSSDDSLMHELIGAVRESTEKSVEVRKDVNAAITQVYQDIIIIKRQLEAEARERPARQYQLDRTLETITTRLDGQDTMLDTLSTAGRWRLRLMCGILLVCSFVALRVALVWIGVL